jgi:Flp pilus assembly protein TadG
VPTRPGRACPHHPVGPGRQPRADDGMATAELAVVLPAIVLALLMSVGAVSAATARMRCADAASVAARLAARGEAPDDVLAAARRVAPAGAVVRLSGTASTVDVTVQASVRLVPVGGLVPPLHVSAGFVQEREPGPPP